MLAIFVAVCVVVRLTFNWIPNFTAVTSLLLLICFYFGLLDSLIVANIMLIATGIYLGMGYWVVGQMLAYSVVLVVYFFLMKVQPLRGLIPQMLIAFVCGLVYGFIISLFIVFILRISNFWAYYLTGLPFDLTHATGNFLFMLVLKKPIERLRKRVS